LVAVVVVVVVVDALCILGVVGVVVGAFFILPVAHCCCEVATWDVAVLWFIFLHEENGDVFSSGLLLTVALLRGFATRLVVVLVYSQYLCIVR
jgi:hypothetical protein